MLAAAALLVGAGVAANLPRLHADWRFLAEAEARSDLVTQEDATFQTLAPWLPPRGRIGYLEPADWPGTFAVRRFYLAEYSPTPRILVIGAGPEFLVAVPEARLDPEPRPGETSRDPRLSGYVLFRRFDNGMRIFRRLE